MSGLTLLVIAKEPLPGRVKTRLTPHVDATTAASLAAAALADTLDAVLAAPARRRVLVLDGRPGPWLPRGFEVVAQAGGGLDERLAAAFAGVRGPAFLVGMDTPQLTRDLLSVDLCSPGAPDALLGPAVDGGFWGVGMRRPLPAVLRGVPMSTDRTGAVLHRRLLAAGLTVGVLPRLRDVDTMADARAVAQQCPQTRFAAQVGRLDSTGAVAPSRSPLRLYEEALRGGRAVRLVATDGRQLPFDLDRWSEPADAADQTLVDRCRGATLDVGCGPGRLAAALAGRGLPVLGVDVAGSAVERTDAAGALALHRSVFETLPGEGRWDTVLLADGNVGIGGDPAALLARTARLLRPGGRLLVEPEAAEIDDVVRLTLRTADDAVVSHGFPWARLGPDAAVRVATACGYGLEERWSAGGRVFLSLCTCSRRS